MTAAWSIILLLLVLALLSFLMRSPKARVALIAIAFLLGASPMAGGFQEWVGQWWDAKPPTSNAEGR
jgi:hypothetical protein